MAKRQSIEFLQEHAQATKFPLQLTSVFGGAPSSAGNATEALLASAAAFAHLDEPDENDSASLLTADLSFVAHLDSGAASPVKGRGKPPSSTTLTCPVTTRDHVEAVCALMTLLGTNAQHMYWQIFHREVIQEVIHVGCCPAAYSNRSSLFPHMA